MKPSDSLIKSHTDYCFAIEDEIYALYLKNGGTTKLDLNSISGKFEIKWYNPRKGGTLEDGSEKYVKGGG